MLSWQASGQLAAGFAVTGVVLRQARRPWSRAAATLLEASLISALYSFWQFASDQSVGDAMSAVRRGEWIARAEQAMHLPSERSVQDLVLGHPLVVQAANLYYDTVHFAAIFVFLMWLWFRHRERYCFVRTVLAATTLVCLAIALVPVAPPRMLVGYVDTAAAYGESVYGGPAVDKLSAMPSVHVAWAVLIGWYALQIGHSRWRLLGPIHAVITVFVVVCTANHWWFDGIVGAAVLIACAYAVRGLARVWQARSMTRPASATAESVSADRVGQPSARWVADRDRGHRNSPI
jgi:PAP2 superfamily